MTDSELVPLVQVDQHKIALLFVDYLKSIEIPAEQVKHDGAYLVLCQPDKVEQAKAAFNEFSKQPYHPKYQQAAWEQGEGNQTSVVSTSSLDEFYDRFLKHAGVVTLVIFVLCWLIFLASQIGYAREIFSSIRFYNTLSIGELFSEPQRLIGPAFFHFSWLHIVFNTMWWWQLGGAIEKSFGKVTIFNVFLLSAIVSNVGQFIVSGANFGGLSGVVYAVVGFVWWTGWLSPEKGLMLPKAIIGFMLVWLLLGFVDVLPVNMANTAHLLGLVVGCLSALWCKYMKEPKRS